jgi:hypothetical protein
MRAHNSEGREIANDQLVRLLREHDGFLTLDEIAEKLDVDPTDENISLLREQCFKLGFRNLLVNGKRSFGLFV